MSSKKEEKKILKPSSASDKSLSLKESIANLDTIIAAEYAKGTPEGNYAAQQAERVKEGFEKMLGIKKKK